MLRSIWQTNWPDRPNQPYSQQVYVISLFLLLKNVYIIVFYSMLILCTHSTYEFLTSFFAEVKEVFPDKFVHVVRQML